jgi:hypothetical protein
MLPTRLIHRIEMNWEPIAASILEETRRDSRVPAYREMHAAEVRSRSEDIVKNLGYWLTSGDEAEVAERYRALGARRRNEGMALAELVAMLQIIEVQLMQHVQWENSARDALEIYGELELMRALRRFFRRVIYYAVAGYENAGGVARAQAVSGAGWPA